MKILMKIKKVLSYFLLNPRLFISNLIKEARILFTSREKFFILMKKHPNVQFGNVVFPLDQENPLTHKGLIETYQDFLVIERAVKSVMFKSVEVDVYEYINCTLKEGDVFFDVGAHFGYFSALGASRVGLTGQVHLFEPAPMCFPYLKEFISQNSLYTFFLNIVGVGDLETSKELTLSLPPHLSSHSFIPEFLNARHIASEKLLTPIVRLDSYITKTGVVPALIKIDVEGYEYKVLKGLENFFKTSIARPSIICEISPSAYPYLGHTLSEIFTYMENFGYKAYYSWNYKKPINNINERGGHNVIFRQNKI
ncbi:MAG TPA: FkbM family methyltransferase [Candidatus Paceibacterota bacterium]|nr:FkbM family methyltransferase [Candidatus Paceibacterota bacterium]